MLFPLEWFITMENPLSSLKELAFTQTTKGQTEVIYLSHSSPSPMFC